MADTYNLYVAEGGLQNIDFTTPAETFPAGTSSGDLVGYGFEASKTYALVIRPAVDTLETPDISANANFSLTAGGEWTGLRPDPVTGLAAKIKAGGVIRLTWRHQIFNGATPDDFEINYGTTEYATGSSATVTYTGAGALYSKELTLSDGVTYWFSVVARDSGLDSTS
ncbi:unnamed protein product, partial [marine sediment metagenome]